jgi:hypothetical protein
VKEPEGVSIGLNNYVFDTAVDLTPATGSVTPLQGVGILEAAGYGEYTGQPVLHLTPGMVSALAVNNAITRVGGHLETALGTPVSVAAGVESKTGGKIDPDQWAYVSGAIVLARSPVQQAAELDRSTNDMVVLYERLYVAAVDCLIAKVKVKVL